MTPSRCKIPFWPILRSTILPPAGDLAHTEHVGGKFSWYYNLWVNEHNRQPLAKIDTVFCQRNTSQEFSLRTVADTGGFFRHDIINNYFVAGPASPAGGSAFFQFNTNQTIYSTGNLRRCQQPGQPVKRQHHQSRRRRTGIVRAMVAALDERDSILDGWGLALRRSQHGRRAQRTRDQVDALVTGCAQDLGNGTTGTRATSAPDSSFYLNQTEHSPRQ